MKKIALLSLAMILMVSSAKSQERPLTEPQQLGAIAGMAWACGANQTLKDYERIISQYFHNTSKTDSIEKDKKEQYVRQKILEYQNKTSFPSECNRILNMFNKQPILGFQLYEDGTLITTDKKMLLPRGVKQRNKNARRIY